MRVILRPNGGEHEIVCDPIVLDTVEKVDKYIHYLHTVRNMLWKKEKKLQVEKSVS